MRKEDKRYEKWLSEVKSSQPALSNPEALTAAVLQRIDRVALKKRKRKFIISSWVFGAIASLLLCLFLNETLFTPVSGEINKEGECYIWQNTPSVLPENWKEMTPLERGRYCSARYMQQKQQRLQRQKCILEIMNKTY